MSSALKVYWLVGGCWIGLLTVQAVIGHEDDAEARHQLPSDVRSSPGGFRSFHFWHSGFSGGK